jgi:twitching motility protein PilT
MPIQTVSDTRTLNSRKEGIQKNVSVIPQTTKEIELLPASTTITEPASQGNAQGINMLVQSPKVDNSFVNQIDTLTNVDVKVSPSNLEDSSQRDLLQRAYSLSDIISEAVSIGASDIHINPGYRVFARKNQSLIMLRSQIISTQIVIGYINEMSRYDTVSSRNLLTELVNKDSIDLGINIYGDRFRVNIARSGGGYSISMRIIPEKIKTLEELSLPTSLKNLTKFQNGLVLITGATGSGKTTTLASLINEINFSFSKKIITLEDPIEYLYPKGLSIVTQRNYGSDFMTWESGIRSALRQDPDILLVGEIRDVETLEASLKLAETGHLVFATLHTNSASATIQRIIDMFSIEHRSLAKATIASTLRAVMTQQLVVGVGGILIPAIELMYVNSAIQNIIKREEIEQLNNVITTSSSEGMVLMSNYLEQLKNKGLI